MKYNTTTIKNDIAYGVTDIISPIRNRIDELEDRVTKLEEKGDIMQRIPLAAALPYKKTWDSYHPIVQDMLMKAKEVVYACEKYDKHGYFIRDCLMVDAADIVLAVWDGKEWGGTWNTIKYVRDKGKEIRYFPWDS